MSIQTPPEQHQQTDSNDTDQSDLVARLVQETQTGLPLVSKPYAAVAQRLGCSESQVFEILNAMLGDSRIRRIGVVPNHYRLGYVANGMSVWDIDDAAISRIGKEVGELDMVSHCYERPRHLPEWPYNLFAMVHGKNREEVREKVSLIAAMLGNDSRSHDILFSSRILKKTGMRLRGL